MGGVLFCLFFFFGNLGLGVYDDVICVEGFGRFSVVFEVVVKIFVCNEWRKNLLGFFESLVLLLLNIKWFNKLFCMV